MLWMENTPKVESNMHNPQFIIIIISYTIFPNLSKFEKSPIMLVSYTSKFIISKNTFYVNNFKTKQNEMTSNNNNPPH
jgi:hypothetical protein